MSRIVAANAIPYIAPERREQHMSEMTVADATTDASARSDSTVDASARTQPVTRKSAVLTGAILVLTAITGMVHLSLGGILFTLNAFGYAGLAGLILIGYWGTNPLIVRFDWFPRLALMGYASATIVGYLVIGPYSTLGWFTKAVEVTLITLLAIDTLRAYGGVGGTYRKVIGSLRG